MGQVVVAKEKPLFRKTHELAKLVRDLKKLSKKAVQVLEAGLNSQDEKVRMLAAEKLLKYYMDAAKETNQDEINRLLLEIKTSGLIGQGSTAQEDDTPVLDFDNLHPDFVDAEVIDMSDVSKIG